MLHRLLILVFLSLPITALAEDVYALNRARWLSTAEACKPQLRRTIVRPMTAVRAVSDSTAFQGWRYENTEGLDSLYVSSFKSIGSITLDFGKHCTGYLSFTPVTLSRCQDAPIRLKFMIGELPAELNTPLDPWNANISRAWMQDEVVTVTSMDSPISIPRRLSGRYLRIDLLGASPDFDFAIGDVSFAAETSAAELKVDVRPDCAPQARAINTVGIETLRECMQTVYEDGPKRDRRLWLGDLYLESLANRYSFRNFDLTKRCLYLFAGLAGDDGVLISNVFEEPEPHPQTGSICLSYCLLFNSALLEYLNDTNDYETARDLWDVARRQVEEALSYVGDDGIFDRSIRDSWAWMFFDWRAGLDTTTPMQGAIIDAINTTTELARKIGTEEETGRWQHIVRKMRPAARENLRDEDSGLMVSGPGRQVSVLSQVWAVRSGILSAEEGRSAITRALGMDDAVQLGTPYATHYLIDAMLRCGMGEEARDYLFNYWGGMISKGADTFWEAYDPDDDFISPYGFFPANSACHAWSCTPVYFINKYPQIFQE